MRGSAGTRSWPLPLELGLRLVLSFGLLIWFAHRYGRDCVEAVVPLLRNLIASLDDRGCVLSLAIVDDGADTVVRMRTMLPQDLVIDGHRFSAANHVLSPSIGTGLILQPAILAFGLVLAWPTSRLVEYPLRLVCAAVMLSLVLILDAPLTLWANYLHIVARESFSVLWLWEEFLVNGGRLALGLVTALVAVKIADKLA